MLSGGGVDDQSVLPAGALHFAHTVTEPLEPSSGL
jgi:hypothetical protein